MGSPLFQMLEPGPRAFFPLSCEQHWRVGESETPRFAIFRRPRTTWRGSGAENNLKPIVVVGIIRT
ncbi:hypothetical protein ATANTOWER_022317, partial [Ataeniobius toweri]|nr:hypothetical protein [Ataeniobius toweri]